jgi:hypothetical protein
MQSRTDKLIAWLESKRVHIDAADKGSIEIHFAGTKASPSLKTIDDLS